MPFIQKQWKAPLWVLTGVLAVGVLTYFVWPSRDFSTRVYVVGVDHSPPYYWVEPNGTVRGMAVDVFEEAARRLGMHLKWKPSTQSLDTLLQNHGVDLWPVVS